MQSLTAGPRAGLTEEEVLSSISWEKGMKTRFGVEILAPDDSILDPQPTDVMIEGGQIDWSYRVPDGVNSRATDTAAVRRTASLSMKGLLGGTTTWGELEGNWSSQDRQWHTISGQFNILTSRYRPWIETKAHIKLAESPTFTRGSTAYLEGIEVGAGVPRYVDVADITVLASDSNEQAQVKVNNVGRGRVIEYEAGTHPLRSITPLPKQTHRGSQSGETIFDGSVEISGWTAEGSSWWAPVPGGITDKGLATNSLYGDVAAQLPEELFRNGTRDRRVSTLAEVPAASAPTETYRAGKWWLDYDNDRVYVGTDPGAATFRLSVTQFALTGIDDPVTVRGLTVRKYATGMRRGPLGGGFGFGYSTLPREWVWEDCTVEDCQGSGFVGSLGGTLRRVTSRRNGHTGGLIAGARNQEDLGKGLRGSGALASILVEDSLFEENGQNRHDYMWEGGGLKITLVTDPEDCTIRNNKFEKNRVHGLWFDVYCETVYCYSNYAVRNSRVGIMFELARGPGEARDNLSEHNGGTGAQIDMDGNLITDNPRADLWIGKSRHLDIWRNVFRTSGGLGVYIQSRDTDYLPYLNDVDVHDNHWELTGTPDGFQSWEGIRTGTDPYGSDNSRLALVDANGNQYWNTAGAWQPFRYGHWQADNKFFYGFSEWQILRGQTPVSFGWTGVTNDPWNSAEWAVKAYTGTVDIQPDGGRMWPAGWGWYHVRATAQVNDFADGEISGQFTVGNNSTFYSYVHFRHSETWLDQEDAPNPQYAYSLAFNSDAGGTVRLRKSKNYGDEQYDTMAMAMSSGTVVKFRIVADGLNFKAKAWTGATEPTTGGPANDGWLLVGEDLDEPNARHSGRVSLAVQAAADGSRALQYWNALDIIPDSLEGSALDSTGAERTDAFVNPAGFIAYDPEPTVVDTTKKNAIFLEEGTSNLLTANQANGGEDGTTTGWTKWGTNTIVSSTEQKWEGARSIKVTYQDDLRLASMGVNLPSSARTTIAVRVLIPVDWDGGAIRISDDGTFAGKTSVEGPFLTSEKGVWVTLKYIFTPGTDLAGGLVLRADSAPTAGKFVYFDGLQVEQKGYATSWHSGGGTRSDESVAIPTSSLPADGPWTIEIDVDPGDLSRRKTWYMPISSWDKFYIGQAVGTAALRLSWRDSGGVQRVADAANGFQLTGKHRVVITLTNNGGTAKVWVDGVLRITANTNEPLIKVWHPDGLHLGWITQQYPHNHLVSGIRVSDVVRTDEELADWRKPFTADSDTTYLLNFNGDLKAETDYSDAWVRWNQGVFVATLPALEYDGAYLSSTLSLADKTHVWARELDEYVTVPFNRNIILFVRETLEQQFGETQFDFPVSDVVVDEDMVFEPGLTWLNVINTVLESGGFDPLIATPEGLPHTRLAEVHRTKPIEKVYEPGGSIKAEASVDPLLPEVPNVLIFVAARGPSLASEGDGIITIKNQDVGPGSILERGGQEVRQKFEVDVQPGPPEDVNKYLREAAYAQAARYFVGGGMRFKGTVGLNPAHDDRDIIGIHKSALGIYDATEEWVVTSWSLPLKPVEGEADVTMPIEAERRVIAEEYYGT